MRSKANLQTPDGRDPDLLVTSVRIHRDLMGEFKRVAAANQRTVSGQMRWLMERNIEEHSSNGANVVRG